MEKINQYKENMEVLKEFKPKTREFLKYFKRATDDKMKQYKKELIEEFEEIL